MNKTNRIVSGLALVALALTLNPQLSTAHAQGTAFTYQGRLSAGGNPASGVYDLSFALYDAASGGTRHGLPVSATAVGVTNGLFTVTLDFGNQFSGSALWLDISVRTNGAVSYAELSPRQPITPAPYAITAENLDGTLPASQLSGTVPLAQIPSAVVTNNESAVTLGSLTLNGSLNLPATAANADVIYAGGSTLIHSTGTNNFFAGPAAGNLTVTGVQNLGVGFAALLNDTSGNYNTASGSGALAHNTSGSENTASGVNALASNTSGSENTASGAWVLGSNTNGSQNTAFGKAALLNNTSGFDNIALGFFAGYYLTTGSNNIDIGNAGSAGESGVIRLGTPGTHKTTILAGNVGIGTNSPQTLLHTVGSGADVSMRAETLSLDKAAILEVFAPGGNGSLVFGGTNYPVWGGSCSLNLINAANGPLTFNHFQNGSPVERMRITSAGNVGIGKTSPATALDVNGTVSAAAFTGSGTGLTSLNAVNLIGSVPDARLSANVALLNASQTFSGQNTFSGAMSLGSTLRMNRNTIYFREGSDPYHGLSWSGSSPFAGISPDGPVLYGGTGGGLGFTGGTTNLALAWNNAGGGNAFTDPAGLNTGSLMPGLTFGPASGEGISSKRTSGAGQFALDFYTASNLRMRIDNSGNLFVQGVVDTINSTSLTLRAAGLSAIKIEPGNLLYYPYYKTINVTMGCPSNWISSDSLGCVISGGGDSGTPNAIIGEVDSATIGVGDANKVYGYWDDYESVYSGGLATIAGGSANIISGSYATIGGGYYNQILFDSMGSTIAGGENNTIQTNADACTIGGGDYNTIEGCAVGTGRNTIAGGQGNTVQTNANC